MAFGSLNQDFFHAVRACHKKLKVCNVFLRAQLGNAQNFGRNIGIGMTLQFRDSLLHLSIVFFVVTIEKQFPCKEGVQLE